MLGPWLIDLGNPVADHPLNRGLAGWWLPLPNSQGGGTLFDLTGRYPGTLTAGPTWAPGPTPGSVALEFDGSNDYVRGGDWFYHDAFTVSCWFRSDNVAAATKNIALKRNVGTAAGTNEWQLVTGSSNVQLAAWNSGGGATVMNITGATTLVNGVWYHVTGVVPGNGGTGKIYLNGVEDASGTQTAAVGNSASEVQFGALSGGGGARYWDGRIGDIRIAGRAYSAAEAWALYDQSRRGHPDTLRRYTPRVWVATGEAAGGGGGGNRRRRVIMGAR
jgi:hypothetical protein